MRIAARENDDIAGAQACRWQVTQFDEAFAFGDQVEDHYALGARFE
jgi:hypothetical protein